MYFQSWPKSKRIFHSCFNDIADHILNIDSTLVYRYRWVSVSILVASGDTSAPMLNSCFILWHKFNSLRCCVDSYIKEIVCVKVMLNSLIHLVVNLPRRLFCLRYRLVFLRWCLSLTCHWSDRKKNIVTWLTNDILAAVTALLWCHYWIPRLWCPCQLHAIRVVTLCHLYKKG